MSHQLRQSFEVPWDRGFLRGFSKAPVEPLSDSSQVTRLCDGEEYYLGPGCMSKPHIHAMDLSLTEYLTSVAAKSEAFHKLQPNQFVFDEISNVQMAPVLGLITQRPDFEVRHLGKVLASRSTKLSWPKVFDLAETSNEYPFLPTTPEIILSIITFLSEFSSEAVVVLLTRKWARVSVQAMLIVNLAAIPSSKLLLADYGLKRVVETGILASHPLNFEGIVWSALDALCREPADEMAAKTLIDSVLVQSPELFLLGGLALPKPWSSIFERILVNLFVLCFNEQSAENSNESPPVVKAVKERNKKFLFVAFLDLYARDATQLNTITKCACREGLLTDWFDCETAAGIGFSLEVLAAADRLELVNVKELLFDKFVTANADSVAALLDFMEIKVAAAATIAASGAPITNTEALTANILTLRTVAAFETLTTSIDVPADRSEQLKTIQIQCLQAYPRLINFGQGHDEAILANSDLPIFPASVEQEMKLCFQKMYEQQIEIRDVIQMLKRLKQSDEPRDQDLFACMVHSLFDEYRFFPEYPVNALATTAVLFGSLIHFRLIDNIPLSIALRFVLESLKQPVESNMFRFGLQALIEMRQRLPEFPKYCSVLLSIPGLASQQQFCQQIREIVYPATSSGLPVEQNEFRSINPDLGLPSLFDEPEERVRSKILFFVNNLDDHSIVAKGKELAALLEPKIHGWFAQYLIVERAINEPNNHELYVKLLTTMHSRNLIAHCLQVCYLQVARLLNHAEHHTQEKRVQLKSLGSFIGLLTFARNKPVLHENVNMKLLLAEGYDLNRNSTVIPFVCRIVERCVDSVIFRPPCAWTMGVLAVMSELYHYCNLKLNLKFEIEVLCSTLKVDIMDIEPANYVRQDHNLELKMNVLSLEEPAVSSAVQRDAKAVPLAPMVAAPPAANAMIGVGSGPPLANFPLPAMPPTAPMGMPPSATLVPGPTAPPGAPAANFGAHGLSPIVNAPSLQLLGNTEFVTHPTLFRLFEMAIYKTAQEVLFPVVDRSASIASFTTKELILKDFATEPDEQRLQYCSHNLASVLAISMSLVTAKEPFIEALIDNLRSLMISNGYGENTVLMDQIPVVAQDNIDVIIPFVEIATRERAISEVDEALMPAYFARQRARATGKSFEQVNPIAAVLPDFLAIKPGGLSPQQLKIYDEFALNHTSATSPASAPLESNSPIMALEQILLQMHNGVEELCQLIADAPENGLSELAEDNPILTIMSRVLALATNSVAREEVILKTSQLVVVTLFRRSKTQLGKEVMCFLLGRLCDLSPLTAKEVVLWLIYSEDERKFDIPAVRTLIQSKLVTATELDVNLAKKILDHNQASIVFAAGLIADAVLGPHPYCLRTEFTGSLEALDVLSKESPPNAVAKQVINALRESVALGAKRHLQSIQLSQKDAKTKSEKEKALQAAMLSKSQLTYIFAEWSRLVLHPCCSERSLHAFVHEMAEHNLLDERDTIMLLLRTALEVSVESYQHAILSETSINEVFTGLHSLSKLIVTIIRTSAMPQQTRVSYARSLFMVAVLIMAKDHEESQENFDGRPYFRLWSNILCEIALIEEEPEFWSEIILVIAEILEILQPLAFPGFTAAWLTLASHRHLLGALLEMPDKKGWTACFHLLKAMVVFLLTYAEGKDFPEPLSPTYRGIFRIFLVVLHDAGMFFVEYHLQFCCIIPSSFIQLRNLVLSAHPPNVDMVDPALPNAGQLSKADMLRKPPVNRLEIERILTTMGTLKFLQQALQQRQGGLTPQLVSAIRQSLTLPARQHDNGIGFDNMGLSPAGFNALVVYVCASLPQKALTSDEDTIQALLCARLLSILTAEGRYLLITALANQLRYPNTHTAFCSEFLLNLFGSFGEKLLKDAVMDVRQIVTRVLLERVVANRPHSWGLMFTFVQLLKGSQFKFWELPFIRIAPEIEQMFSSLYSHFNTAQA